MTGVQNELTRSDLERWIRDFCQQIMVHHESLSNLDAATGDADHGSNMERGMSSLLVSLPGWDPTSLPGPFLKDVGLHVVSKVGGSSGALYGTIFLRMARTLGDHDPHVSDGALASAFEAAAQGIVDRGKVKPGDKTMLDALHPAVRTLRDELAAGRSRAEALAAAARASDAGREATADMAARRGKSSYARENSRGTIDPGAASMAILIRSAQQTLG